MTYLFDTHCHLDLYPDYAALINEIEQEQIYTIAVTNAPSVFRQCATLTRKCKYIRAALGLHPELVMQRFRELDMMIEMLSETRYIGEVGLDYVTRNHGERELQRKVFQCIIEKCAGQGGKIVTVHSRRAADDVIDIIGDTFPGVILLHWFTGTDRALARALAYGFYFSVNSAMLASPRGRQLVSALPRARVLTETDGPFVEIAGRAARPSDTGRTVSLLSQLWHESLAETSETLWRNFSSILQSHIEAEDVQPDAPTYVT